MIGAPKSRRAPEVMAAALLLFLLAMNVYRAWSFSVVMDEAYTYLSFVAPPWKQLLTTYSPNHHILHSLLCKFSIELFGLSEFTLRLPSLTGGLIYYVAVFALSRVLFGTGWLMLLSVALATMNPMIVDYMSQARGYSLALGFYVAAMVASLQSDRRWLAACGAALGLCVSANLTFAIPVIAMNLLVITAGRGKWKRAWWLLAPEVALATVVMGGPLLHLIHSGSAEFLGGFTSPGDALNNFAIASVVHDWDQRAPVQLSVWLYPVFRWAVVATLIAGTTLMTEFRTRLFAGSLLLSVAILIMVHAASPLPWPFARMVLYAWPLLVFTICLLIQRYRSLRMPYLAFCAALLTQFVLQLNVDHYGWLGYNAGTRQIARQISGVGPIRIAVSGPLFACMNFYGVMYSKGNWTLTPYSGSNVVADYVVLDIFDSAKDIGPGYRKIYTEPVSGATIQRIDTQAE